MNYKNVRNLCIMYLVRLLCKWIENNQKSNHI